MKRVEITTIQSMVDGTKEEVFHFYDCEVEKNKITYYDDNEMFNTITYNEDEVVVENDNKLVFKKGDTYETTYDLKIYSFNVKVVTNDLKVEGNKIEMVYDFYMDGKKVCETNFSLEVL